MSLINGILENFAAIAAHLVAIAGSIDPTGTLYGLQGATYGSAAVAATSNDHRMLARCYLASAFLHGLIGVSHVLH
jgi:hypothetical protein